MTSRNYLKLLAILALISSTFCTNKRASPPRPAQVPPAQQFGPEVPKGVLGMTALLIARMA